MRRTSSLAAAALAALVIALCAQPAWGQTSYPPGPCRPLSGTQSNGTLSVGQATTIVLTPVCAFEDGTPVATTLNGVALGGRSAVKGAVSVPVRVESATRLIADASTAVPAICGVNTIVASGRSAVAQAVVTQTATFTVICPAAAAAAAAAPGRASPAQSGPGSVAFTGAAVLALVVVAFVVLVVGATALFGSRRQVRPWG